MDNTLVNGLQNSAVEINVDDGTDVEGDVHTPNSPKWPNRWNIQL